jgi:hypothetical protein
MNTSHLLWALASVNLTPDEDKYLKIDLIRGVISCKWDPNQILERNPFLILKIIQLASENELDVDPSIISAAKTVQVQKSLLKHRDKLWDQLATNIFTSKNPGEAAEMFATLGLRDLLFTLNKDELKEIGLTDGPLVSWEINPHSPHHNLNLWQHCLATLKNMTKNTKKKVRKDPAGYAVRNLAAILHDVGKRYSGIHEWVELGDEGEPVKRWDAHARVGEKMARKMLGDLGAPKDIIDSVCTLIVHHMDHKMARGDKKDRKTLIRKLVEDLSDEDSKKEVLKSLVDLAKSDVGARIKDSDKMNKRYDKIEDKAEKKVKGDKPKDDEGPRKDQIPGGLADNTTKKFDPKQLAQGIRVEKEHTNDPEIAREIATDHLVEHKNYYVGLKKMEDKLERQEKSNKKAAEFAHLFLKFAQDQTNTPNVTIQPGRPEANCALEILKRWKPDYFIGVREIVIGPSANYGYVQSGPDKDPSVIYINADRIVSEAGGQRGQGAALACAQVIAHEKGHVASFDPKQGFVGGESPAQSQEQDFEKWLKSGGMQQVESLPCYQALPKG